MNKDVNTDFLSCRGCAITTSPNDTMVQGMMAKGKKFNATVGIGLDEDGNVMNLSSITSYVNLEPNDFIAYAPPEGKESLRLMWQELLVKKNPTLKDKRISLPVITSGLTHALSIVGLLFLESNSSILIPNPYWGNYKLIYSDLQDVRVVTYNLFKNYKFTLEYLERELDKIEGRFALLLNFPHNPTGYSPSSVEVDALLNLIKNFARNNQIIIICDDAYFGLVYRENVLQESIFSYLADLDENLLAIKVDGITKEYASWGLRLGFITFGRKGAENCFYENLAHKAKVVVRGTVSTAANLSQELILQGLKNQQCEEGKEYYFHLLKRRYEKIDEILQKNRDYRKYFIALPFNSGYFLCLKPLHNSAREIQKQLLEKYSTGIVVVDDLMRIAFASVTTSLLDQLFENIYRSCKDLVKLD